METVSTTPPSFNFEGFIKLIGKYVLGLSIILFLLFVFF
jgi:hypothetical protein